MRSVGLSTSTLSENQQFNLSQNSDELEVVYMRDIFTAGRQVKRGKQSSILSVPTIYIKGTWTSTASALTQSLLMADYNELALITSSFAYSLRSCLSLLRVTVRFLVHPLEAHLIDHSPIHMLL